MAELRFPRVEHPDVSIVMLTYNDLEWTPRALRACLENTPPSYELIVVDNGSTDGTAEFLTGELSGARVILNGRNHGFGVANNLGAGHARARYVFFLNSDAFVHSNWLPPLLARIEADESVAAVGPRLLNLDGSLQLAGALLTRAGATVVYGMDDDPGRPEYSFPRYVDFSGACLLFRRSAFNEVGGFDPAFGLIYFEDADLSLALWDRGYRIVYEPASTITHVGGSGGEPSEAILRLALRNRALFERRWRNLLASYPLAPLVGRRRTLAARDRRCSDRILVFDAACANALARALPSARVTLAAAEHEGLLTGIELALDPEDVLRERRFHYDAVVADSSTFDSLHELLLETQPQAVRIDLEELAALRGGIEPARLREVVAAAGVADAGRSYDSRDG